MMMVRMQDVVSRREMLRCRGGEWIVGGRLLCVFGSWRGLMGGRGRGPGVVDGLKMIGI